MMKTALLMGAAGSVRRRRLSPFLLDLDFTNGFPSELTHVRASGATMVDDNGNVAWAEENVLYPSVPANASANPTRITLLENTGTDPEGGSNVSFLREDGSTGTHYLRDGISPNYRPYPGVLGARVKFGGRNVSIGQYGIDSNRQAKFDLVNGVVISMGSDVLDAGIEPIGDTGYFTIWASYAHMSSSSGAYDLNLLDGENAGYAGDNSKGVYVAGLWVNRGAAPHPYHPTTDNFYHAPRITHDKDGNALGYLHEPQATNLVPWSQIHHNNGGAGDYSGPAMDSTVITENDAAAPDGSNTAARWVTSIGLAYRSVASVTGIYTRSLFVKRVSGEAEIRIGYAATGSAGSRFNLVTGTKVSDSPGYTGKITEHADGWFRLETTFAASSYLFETIDFAGAGEYLLWGAQVESGTAATSLIPTYGASTTRQADTLSAYSLPEMLTEASAIIDVRIDPNHPSASANSSILNLYNTSNAGEYFQCFTRTAREDRITTSAATGNASSTPEPNAPIADKDIFRHVAISFGSTNLLVVDGASYSVAPESSNPVSVDRLTVITPFSPAQQSPCCLRSLKLANRNLGLQRLQTLTAP